MLNKSKRSGDWKDGSVVSSKTTVLEVWVPGLRQLQRSNALFWPLQTLHSYKQTHRQPTPFSSLCRPSTHTIQTHTQTHTLTHTIKYFLIFLNKTERYTEQLLWLTSLPVSKTSHHLWQRDSNRSQEHSWCDLWSSVFRNRTRKGEP